MARKGAANLKLENYSDREVLHLMNDLADENGWVLIEHLAERIGIRVAGMSDAQLAIHARRCLGVRLGWIKRLSATVEQKGDEHGVWRLTSLGQQVVKAKLNASIDNALGQMNEANLLNAIDVVSRRYIRANQNTANLLRREWQYGTHKNRRR